MCVCGVGGGGIFQSQSAFDDPFFTGGTSRGMFGGPMMMGGGGDPFGSMMANHFQQHLGGSTSFSSSSSSSFGGGGGGGISQSTSTSIRNVNGVQERVTVTTLQDQNVSHGKAGMGGILMMTLCC